MIYWFNMGKRSDFARRPMDSYQTIDPRAVEALLPFLTDTSTYAEPCRGEGRLERQLDDSGLICRWSSDIDDVDTPVDALSLTIDDLGSVDAIITNPPWSRPILHPMIRHFQSLAPTWLLFDADWAHTKQAAPYLPQCSHIVSVGRLRWIEGTKQTGKDNCAWYRFDAQHADGPRFFGAAEKPARKKPHQSIHTRFDLAQDGEEGIYSSAEKPRQREQHGGNEHEDLIDFNASDPAARRVLVYDLIDLLGDTPFERADTPQGYETVEAGRSVSDTDLRGLLCINSLI